jgi:hypothetical protein
VSESWAVDVTLPDGQVLRGRLLAQRRDQGGRGWHCLVAVSVWGGSQPQPAEIVLTVPAGKVGRVAGTDYVGVPTEAETPPAWAITGSRVGGGEQLLHALDCDQASDPVVIPPRVASETLALPSTRLCPQCRPEVP